MRRTFSPRVLPRQNGFAGLFQLDFASKLFSRNYADPVLVSTADGVGSKLRIAILTDRHDTVGVDLVAMSVNDAICSGAEPLFFMDYVAMAEENSERLAHIVKGVSNGCLQADCALLGGETSIMPDLLDEGDYDLAGFCVGVVERKNMITGAAIVPGDVILGVVSSGFHSNGFSLVRKVVFDMAGLGVNDFVPELQKTVGETLLNPTSIYAAPVRRVLSNYRNNVVHGLAHVKGGGIALALDRILPNDCQAVIDRNEWKPAPEFAWLAELGSIDQEAMYRVFNMGLGLLIVINRRFESGIRRIFEEYRIDCVRIGEIRSGAKECIWKDGKSAHAEALPEAEQPMVDH